MEDHNKFNIRNLLMSQGQQESKAVRILTPITDNKINREEEADLSISQKLWEEQLSL